MRKYRYDNMGDANAKLVDTILFYQDRAIYVRGISDDLDLRASFILDDDPKMFTIRQDDPDLKYYCPRLGYVNTPQQSLYVMRQPVRRWKQGIDMRAIVCPSVGRAELSQHINHKSLARCLEGNYPSFEEVMNSFEKRMNPFLTTELNSLAFSREFCLDRAGSIGYKGLPVGQMDGKQIVLSEKFKHLENKLEKVL